MIPKAAGPDKLVRAAAIIAGSGNSEMYDIGRERTQIPLGIHYFGQDQSCVRAVGRNIEYFPVRLYYRRILDQNDKAGAPAVIFSSEQTTFPPASRPSARSIPAAKVTFQLHWNGIWVVVWEMSF